MAEVSFAFPLMRDRSAIIIPGLPARRKTNQFLGSQGTLTKLTNLYLTNASLSTRDGHDTATFMDVTIIARSLI